MAAFGKIIALGGWVFLLILGVRQTNRKQSRLSGMGGGLFYYLSVLWMFASIVIYLSIYSGTEEPNLSRTFKEKTCYIWQTYRNEQLWIRTASSKTFVSELPKQNQGCQNISWLDENTIALVLKTNTGIFKQANTEQYFSLWLATPKENSEITPISSDGIKKIRKLIKENPEQLGKDLENFKTLTSEYTIENMGRILASDENPQMAAYVAGVVGDLEGKKALPVLVTALRKKEKQIYNTVLDSLEKLGKSHQSIAFYLSKAGLEGKQDQNFLKRIFKIFGESKDPRLIEALIKYMEDEETSMELRDSAAENLKILTKQKFVYDATLTKSKRTIQLNGIKEWYGTNKKALFESFYKANPEIAKIPDSTEKKPDSTEKKPDSTEKKPDSTEKKPDSTEKKPDSTEKKPDSTEKKPDSTEKKPDSTEKKPDSTKKGVPSLKEQLAVMQERNTLKKLFVAAYQKGLTSPYHSKEGAYPLKHGIPEGQWAVIKGNLKEALKRHLAKSFKSSEEQKIRFRALASFQQSTLPLEQIASYETLTEWAKSETPENQAFIQTLLKPSEKK